MSDNGSVCLCGRCESAAKVAVNNSYLLMQMAVTVYLKSKLLLPYGFTEQKCEPTER